MINDKYKVLIIDDDPSGPKKYFELAMDHDQKNQYDHDPLIHETPDLRGIDLESVHLILLDYDFGGGATGLSVLTELFEINQLRKKNEIDPIRVILYSAYEDLSRWKHELLVMYNKGVIDFVSKDDDPILLKFKMDRALELVKQQREYVQLKNKYRDLKKMSKPDIILGESHRMKNVLKLIEKVAPQNTTVLITGEHGTGKELVARSIYLQSKRRNESYETINCAALPDKLIEGELFGSVKGAYTDAHKDRKGYFEKADGGTICLDEIGELNYNSQAKLLRVLEQKEIQVLGKPGIKRIDVRIIAATNKNLKDAIKEKTFREDLYYRLNVFPIHVPPLRERKEDIEILVNHFMIKKKQNIETNIEGISKSALRKLTQHNWPGNIRELENKIEQILIVGEGSIITDEHIEIDTNLRDSRIINEHVEPSDSFDPAPIVDKLFKDYYKTNKLFVEKYKKDGHNKIELLKEYFDERKNEQIKKEELVDLIKTYIEKRKITIQGLSGLSKYKKKLDNRPKNKLIIAEKIEEKLRSEGKKTPQKNIAMIMGMSRSNFAQMKRSGKGK